MYLAPRCRLICPRCSRRRGVESVHLRFLYVSWVQIDVSQIGLFSERARKETPSAQYARKRAPPSTRSHPERPGPAGAGARRRPSRALLPARLRRGSRAGGPKLSRPCGRERAVGGRARSSEVGSALALRAGGLGRRGRRRRRRWVRARALLPQVVRPGARARAPGARLLFASSVPEPGRRQAGGRPRWRPEQV